MIVRRFKNQIRPCKVPFLFLGHIKLKYYFQLLLQYPLQTLQITQWLIETTVSDDLFVFTLDKIQMQQ